MKKASSKKNKTAKRRTQKKPALPTSKGVDMGVVRQKISKIVSGAAENIAKKLVTKAEDGELAHSKYLFEMTGLYPIEDAAARPEEDSLAKTLLQRMGLPTTPVVEDDNGEARELTMPPLLQGEAKSGDDSHAVEGKALDRGGDEAETCDGDE